MSDLTVSLFVGVRSPEVKEASSFSWEEFVDGFREPKYDATTPKNELPLWSPAEYDPPVRKTEHVQRVFALTLDADEPPVPNADELRAHLTKYRGFAYSSPRATAGAPRWRPALAFSRPVTREEYSRIWPVVVSELGFPVGAASKDPARQWYVPRRGEDGYYELLVFNGEPIDVDAVLARAPATPVATVKPTTLAAPPRSGRAAKIAAAASLLGAAWPEKGRRSEARMALTGGLHHDGWDQAAATSFLQAVHAHVERRGDQDDAALATIVASAFARGARGESLLGWPRLEQHLDAGVAKSARDLLRRDDMGTVGQKIGIPKPTAPDAADAPPPVLIESGPDLNRVVGEAANALGRDAGLFKRAGELVRIVKIDASHADDAHREGTPHIRPLPAATLKVALTRSARWIRKVEDKKNEGEWRQVVTTPSDDIVAAVAQMGDWPHVRRLVGVVEAPVMRADGSVLQVPGYDARTAFFFDPCGVRFAEVPEAPTREEANAALQRLFEPFQDFPHATKAAGMVPVASVLSLLARPAIEGNVPAFLFEATTRGSGKTKLADVVSVIATGRLASKVTFPRTDDELEKLLGGYARKGASLFCFDNISVDNPFGGAPLDKVLTSGGSVDLRILGKTQVPTFEWRAVVLGTGNNISLRGDTTRRVLVCRLESPLENPEDRDDFRHPDLLAWVGKERARLAADGLTVLRGYVSAGRPDVGVRPWGSFESWSALVPSAIVWAAGAADVDPQLTRPTLDSSAEPEKTLLERLLLFFPAGEWRVRDLLEGAGGIGPTSKDLTAVLEEVAPSAEKNRAQFLGRVLDKWKGRVVGGRRLLRGQDKKSKVSTWCVERL